MATTAPSCTPLISWIEGSSTSASKIGKSPVEGLKKMYSTPADLSCCTNNAPPVPCTSRIADAGAVAESDCAIAFTATELIPSAERPVMSLRREIPLSRYCLIRSFIELSSQGLAGFLLAVVPAKAGTQYSIARLTMSGRNPPHRCLLGPRFRGDDIDIRHRSIHQWPMKSRAAAS